MFRYVNSTEWTNPSECEMEYKKDININIKQELLDSDCGDSISNGGTTSATHPHNNECMDVDDSKELVNMIKLETLEDSGLESQEEILPDLSNTLPPLIKDEQIIWNLLCPKSDVFQVSNEKVTQCIKTEALSSSDKEEIGKYKDNKRNSLKKTQLTALVVPTETSFKSCLSKQILEAIKQRNSLEEKEEGEHTTCKIFVKTLESEVSADSLIKTINKKLDEYMENNNGDLRDGSDKEVFSDQSTCCGSIFCHCNRCKKFREALQTTQVKPNRNYKYNCGLCKKKFPWKFLLKEHEESKCKTLKLFSCDYCTKSFSLEKYIKSHVRNCHTAKSESEKKVKLSCDLCEKSFSFKSGLRVHMRNIHFLQKIMNLKHACEICQKVYSNKSGLDRHKLDSHIDDKFECGHCSIVYNSKNKLRSHIQIAHFQTSLECGRPGCDKVFASAGGLKNHEMSCHLNLPPRFICETCGKKCRTKLSFQNHIRIHTDEKPYICQVCGKSFRSESNLEQHSRTHSDKRPYSCGLCPMAFKIKHHLRQHMAVHGMVHTSVKRKQRSN